METNYQFNSKNLEKVLKESQSDSSNLVLIDHQLLKNNRTLNMDKMNYKEVYPIIISSKVNIPTSQIYFEKDFLSIIFHGMTSTRFPAKPL